MTPRARTGERGAAVVDFVLVLLVLLPLVIGILQLALVLHVRNTLASAAAEGARHAAVAGSSGVAGELKRMETHSVWPSRTGTRLQWADIVRPAGWNAPSKPSS